MAGFSTKLHALVSARGELVRYLVTGGEVNDITQARDLVCGREGSAVVGDRAYDSNTFIEHIAAHGMRVVIPARSNRKESRELDAVGYARRNVIERWFGRLKVYRRVATRYDKTLRSYLGFVAFAAALSRNEVSERVGELEGLESAEPPREKALLAISGWSA